MLDYPANPRPGSLYLVRFSAPEFTSLCPVTGQPDFAHLVIDYVPDKWLVESKSLKLFLGSFRSVLIPVVTIPLSIIGAGTLMLALGFSLNLLTLLAMVLAIGIVVDDAIVVLENVERLMRESGMKPFEASLQAMREVSGAVVAAAAPVTPEPDPGGGAPLSQARARSEARRAGARRRRMARHRITGGRTGQHR